MFSLQILSVNFSNTRSISQHKPSQLPTNELIDHRRITSLPPCGSFSTCVALHPCLPWSHSSVESVGPGSIQGLAHIDAPDALPPNMHTSALGNLPRPKPSRHRLRRTYCFVPQAMYVVGHSRLTRGVFGVWIHNFIAMSDTSPGMLRQIEMDSKDHGWISSYRISLLVPWFHQYSHH